MLIRIGHNCVEKKKKHTRKLTYHLKQAQGSISNLSNLYKNVNSLPLRKTNREY